MDALRSGALAGLALLLATLPTALAGPTTLAEAEVHADVDLDVTTPPLHDAPSAPEPAATTDATKELTLAPLRVQADARLEATSRADAPVGNARASATAATAAFDLAERVPEPVREVAPPALAAAGLAAVLQAMGVWRAAGVAGVALYSRLAKSDLLDNEHRDRVYKLVQEHPGLSMSEIGERAGLGWGTLVYHLDRLEKAGFVASERAGLHRCFFPVGTLPRGSREGMSVLKADTTRSVARFLVERPGASQSDVCASLGLSASAASKQVTKLEKAGLVRRERDWKTVHLYPEATLPDLLGPAQLPTTHAPAALAAPA